MKIRKLVFGSAHNRFSDAIARGEILKPAKAIAEMQTIVIVESD